VCNNILPESKNQDRRGLGSRNGSTQKRQEEGRRERTQVGIVFSPESRNRERTEAEKEARKEPPRAGIDVCRKQTDMTGMESPLNKGLGSTISHIENTRDVIHDDIVLEGPLLNRKSNCQVANDIGGVDEVTNKDQTMAKTKSAFQFRMLNRILKMEPGTGSKIHTKGQSRSKIQGNSIRQGFMERTRGNFKITSEGNREIKDIGLSMAKSIKKAGEGRFVHNCIRGNKGSHLDSFIKAVEGKNVLHGRGITKKSATGTTVRNKTA
jgi:hypothetical protein